MPSSGICQIRSLSSSEANNRQLDINSYHTLQCTTCSPVTRTLGSNGSNLKSTTGEPHSTDGIFVGSRPGLAVTIMPTRPPGPEIGTAMNLEFA
jgi:hypothetical protein